MSDQRPHPDESLLLRMFFLVVILGLLVVAGALVAFDGAVPTALAGAAILVLIALFAGVLYRRWIRSALLHDGLEGNPVWPDDSIEDVEEAASRFGRQAALASVQFLRLLAEPRSLIVRITETLKPLNRSTEVTSAFVIRATGASEERRVIPLLRKRRQVVDEGLVVTDHDGSTSVVLPRSDVIAYCVLAIERVLGSIDEAAAEQFRNGLRARLITMLLTSRVVDSEVLKDLTTSFKALAQNDDRIDLIVRSVEAMAFYDFVCVATRLPKIPSATGQAAAQPTSLAGLRSNQSSRRSESLMRFVVRRRVILVYDKPPSTTQSALAGLRTAFGIPVSTVFAQLNDATRARSFHVELIGPEHSFVARQVIYRPDPTEDDRARSARAEVVDEPDGGTVALRRRGQRHAHLYLRTAQPLTDWLYAVTFYERMPSSLAPVAVSASALAVLTAIGLLTLRLGNSSHLVGTPAFAATLLGVPSAISIWSGVQSGRAGTSGSGGLLARVGSIGTIVLALATVLVNLEAPQSGQYWTLMTWLTALNAVLLVIAWYVRASFVHALLYGEERSGIEYPGDAEVTPAHSTTA